MRESSSELRFGRYEVLFRIAAGGMAEVYAARMVGEGGFEKPVAVKRMLPQLAEDERFVQMFLDEGRLAAHISSPHVVQTLDLGRAEDDSLYLVMELVVGVSLSALIRALLRKKQQLPVNAVVDILAQAAEGLHDAHEARTMYGQPLEIVHRDVSPQNILVDVSGRVRITDFGVARALERATHTQSGEVKGKIGYFAPEQVKGKQVDRRTDVFALGIVAWETLAGRRLFAGDNPAQTLDFVMSMEIPRLDALRTDVPRELADAVAHALERDLDRRTPTAGDFADELRRALRPAGAAAVGGIVREHGGEALMKLEDGLRAQSPSSLSRVRKAQSASSSGRLSAEPVAPVPASELDATRQLLAPDAAATRPELPAATGPGQAPTAILVAPPAHASVSSGLPPIVALPPAAPPPPLGAPSPTGMPVGAPDPFASPLSSLDVELEPRPSRTGVLVAAVAAIGLVAAIGVGAMLAMDRSPPEPTAVPLPPVAPPPTAAAVAPVPAVPATPPVVPAVAPPPTTQPVAPVAGTRPTVRRPGGRTEPASRAGREEREPEVEREETPRVATSTRREPEPPATGRTTSGSGSSGTTMRTGLVGLGEFEDEIGQ